MATQEENVAIIRQFCRLAQSYGVLSIEANYDGSGDSGDIDFMVRSDPRPSTVSTFGHVIAPVSPNDTANTNLRCEVLRWFFREIVKQKDTLITERKIDEFEQAVCDLLPDYWANDDGAFGEIQIDIFEHEIKIEHNERVVEINTHNFTYK